MDGLHVTDVTSDEIVKTNTVAKTDFTALTLALL